MQSEKNTPSNPTDRTKVGVPREGPPRSCLPAGPKWQRREVKSKNWRVLCVGVALAPGKTQLQSRGKTQGKAPRLWVLIGVGSEQVLKKLACSAACRKMHEKLYMIRSFLTIVYMYVCCMLCMLCLLTCTPACIWVPPIFGDFRACRGLL